MAKEEAMTSAGERGVSTRASGDVTLKLSAARLVLRWMELIALFGVLPGAMWWARSRWPEVVNPALIPTLLVVFVMVLIALLRDCGFDRRQLWNVRGLFRATPVILACVPVPAIMMIGGIVAWRPELWLAFPRERPTIFAAVMILYPLLSVYPQEVIWRTFFFHRYQPLFGAGRSPSAGWLAGVSWPMVLVSGLAFGWMHCVFNNWVAVLLTIPGGWLFAFTYARTRSTAAVWLEHAFWGCFAFTIGLGRYFYGGSSG